MEQSILKSIKKILNVPMDYDVFDLDILTHINSAFGTLNQLGIGPEEGFFVENEEPVWENFLGSDPRLNAVKSYVFLKVKLLFDPPTNSFVLGSMERQVAEAEWRLTVARDYNRQLPEEV